MIHSKIIKVEEKFNDTKSYTGLNLVISLPGIKKLDSISFYKTALTGEYLLKFLIDKNGYNTELYDDSILKDYSFKIDSSYFTKPTYSTLADLYSYGKYTSFYKIKNVNYKFEDSLLFVDIEFIVEDDENSFNFKHKF